MLSSVDKDVFQEEVYLETFPFFIREWAFENVCRPIKRYTMVHQLEIEDYRISQLRLFSVSL